MEADPVPETRSSYCFTAISVPGKLQLRRSSCYCENCARKKCADCLFIGVVRNGMHSKLYPKPFTDERKRWREEGWIDFKMVLKEEREMRQTRGYSNETRKAFAAGLGAGKCFGVYCGGSGARCRTSSSGWRRPCQRTGIAAEWRLRPRALIRIGISHLERMCWMCDGLGVWMQMHILGS
jgi:hypothetical protein